MEKARALFLSLVSWSELSMRDKLLLGEFLTGELVQLQLTQAIVLGIIKARAVQLLVITQVLVPNLNFERVHSLLTDGERSLGP